MQRQSRVAVYHGMTGIVAALVTHHVVEVTRNEVGDLAFTLVAPLGTNQYDSWHACPVCVLSVCRNVMVPV